MQPSSQQCNTSSGLTPKAGGALYPSAGSSLNWGCSFAWAIAPHSCILRPNGTPLALFTNMFKLAPLAGAPFAILGIEELLLLNNPGGQLMVWTLARIGTPHWTLYASSLGFWYPYPQHLCTLAWNLAQYLLQERREGWQSYYDYEYHCKPTPPLHYHTYSWLYCIPFVHVTLPVWSAWWSLPLSGFRFWHTWLLVALSLCLAPSNPMARPSVTTIGPILPYDVLHPTPEVPLSTLGLVIAACCSPNAIGALSWLRASPDSWCFILALCSSIIVGLQHYVWVPCLP